MWYWSLCVQLWHKSPFRTLLVHRDISWELRILTSNQLTIFLEIIMQIDYHPLVPARSGKIVFSRKNEMQTRNPRGSGEWLEYLIHEIQRPSSSLRCPVSLFQRDNGQSLTDEEILAEVRTFMFAGLDTVTSGKWRIGKLSMKMTLTIGC